MMLLMTEKLKGDNRMLQDKPDFKLEINAKNLNYIVDVNGSAVIREFDPNNQVVAEFPINHWMHPEKTNFGLVVFPNYGEGYLREASISVTLIIKDNNDEAINYRLPILIFEADSLNSGEELTKSIDSGDYRLAADNQVKKEKGQIYINDIDQEALDRHDGAFKLIRDITIPNRLPLWEFFSCDELPDYEALSKEAYRAEVDSLFVEYKKIQDALAANDLASIKPMYAQRSKEMEQAFYYEQPTWSEETFTEMQADIDDSEWTLRIRKPEDLGITFEHNRKLASLTLGGFGGSNAIGFKNSNGAYSSYPLTFCRKDGQWLLMR